MTLTDAQLRDAESRMEARLKKQPHATRAVYDEKKGRIVVGLSNGLEIGFPVELAQGLAGASAADLSVIEITPTGLGLHWPRLDTDLHLPALMEGFFGSRRWMAQLMGTAGGRARSTAKRAAARRNGQLGGRPRKKSRA